MGSRESDGLLEFIVGGRWRWRWRGRGEEETGGDAGKVVVDAVGDAEKIVDPVADPDDNDRSLDRGRDGANDVQKARDQSVEIRANDDGVGGCEGGVRVEVRAPGSPPERAGKVFPRIVERRLSKLGVVDVVNVFSRLICRPDRRPGGRLGSRAVHGSERRPQTLQRVGGKERRQRRKEPLLKRIDDLSHSTQGEDWGKGRQRRRQGERKVPQSVQGGDERGRGPKVDRDGRVLPFPSAQRSDLVEVPLREVQDVPRAERDPGHSALGVLVQAPPGAPVEHVVAGKDGLDR